MRSNFSMRWARLPIAVNAAFAIPTIASGGTAALSLIFYLLLARLLGEQRLGSLLLVQAGVAIAVIATIPQALLSLLGAPRRSARMARFSEAVQIEWIGASIGLALVVTASQLPILPAAWRSVAPVIFVSLAVQSLGSIMGWLRTEQLWSRYLFWNIGPNLIRIPLCALALVAQGRGALQIDDISNRMVVLWLFLVPDLLRLAIIALPLWLRLVRPTPIARLRPAIATIRHNWFYDLGSAIVDNADRIVVGVLLSPTTLVLYFFARRFGTLTSMITEPWFAESFRRGVAAQSHPHARILTVAYGLAALVAGVMLSIAAIVSNLSAVNVFLPPTILQSLLLFAAIVAIDALMAGTRWSRYLAHLRRRGTQLLIVRLTAFACFTTTLFVTQASSSPIMIAVALLIAWLVEASYVGYSMTRIERDQARSSE